MKLSVAKQRIIGRLATKRNAYQYILDHTNRGAQPTFGNLIDVLPGPDVLRVIPDSRRIFVCEWRHGTIASLIPGATVSESAEGQILHFERTSAAQVTEVCVTRSMSSDVDDEGQLAAPETGSEATTLICLLG